MVTLPPWAGAAITGPTLPPRNMNAPYQAVAPAVSGRRRHLDDACDKGRSGQHDGCDKDDDTTGDDQGGAHDPDHGRAAMRLLSRDSSERQDPTLVPRPGRTRP